MNPPTIRTAEASDAAALAELSGQLGYPSPAAELLQRLLLLLKRSDQLVLVAEREGTVVGWIHASEVFGLESRPHVVIAGLVVSQGALGNGYGQCLVDAVARWASGRGFQELRVRTNVVRQEAHGFYRHLGFHSTKTQTVFSLALGAQGLGPAEG